MVYLSDSLLTWFDSYLSSRTQFVIIHNYSSFPISVTSGVPQGGHLFLWLFNIIFEQ
jgi:hypothetical protein